MTNRTFKKSSEEDVKLIRKLFAEGESINGIARKFKRDRDTIRYWIKKDGIPNKRKIPKEKVGLSQSSYTPKICNRQLGLSPAYQRMRNKWIYRYARNGTSIKEIAKVFYTVPLQEIKKIVNEIDLQKIDGRIFSKRGKKSYPQKDLTFKMGSI